jgi:hypothetical protein
MKDYVSLQDLAKRLGVHHSCLWRRLQRDGIKPVYGPVMTDRGPQRARWVPVAYAYQLLELYEQARVNTKE